MSELFDLSGKVCIVIGGTKGIGRATTSRMAEHGAKIVLTSRNAESAQARAEEINAERGAEVAIGVKYDMADRTDGPAVVKAAVEKWGRIDTLMCNAARIILGRLQTLSEDMDELDESFQQNVRNYAALTRQVVPVMKENGGGSVIFVSAPAALIASPPYTPYGLAKSGLLYLTYVLSAELGPDNIRVNAILPGSIQTNRPSGFEATGGSDLMVANTPLGRRGMPDDIAAMAVLLAAPGGAYITGQQIAVEGGLLVTGREGITDAYDFTVAKLAEDAMSLPVSE